MGGEGGGIQTDHNPPSPLLPLKKKKLPSKSPALLGLSVPIFACIYFCELKKIVFREYLFSITASFWKFRVFKFQPQRKKNKKKTVESRDIRLMFLLRSTERQAGHDQKTVKKNFLRVFNFAKFTKIREIREYMYSWRLVRLG